tara:strand:+ start:229 stop:390 length:162 start_codon:yes stop_codon:yes gene_type:complete
VARIFTVIGEPPKAATTTRTITVTKAAEEKGEANSNQRFPSTIVLSRFKCDTQ